MTKRFRWTNSSVTAFAEGGDPVEKMEQKARELALRAMDEGWTGPPFDPLALAQWRNMRAEARGDIPDARTVPTPKGELLLQYNPTRPRGRLRFSIAHEIAHSLFPDCADEIRHRDGGPTPKKDNWQLEVLCNIGAAELLMPLGSFSDELSGQELSMEAVNKLRKTFDVSVEACLIRLVKLATTRCASFCASRHDDGKYRIDYVISAPGWKCPIVAGQVVADDSVIPETNAIGFTSIGRETWGSGPEMRVECMGLAPYPGGMAPRVVGLFVIDDSDTLQAPQIIEINGDVLKPRGEGPRIIAHVIPDQNVTWGGAGVASKLRVKYPEVWKQFKSDATGRVLPLGKVFTGHIGEQVSVAHMVAQHGIGNTPTQRLRYAALADCLMKVRDMAQESGASVHMPRVGTGHGGANWAIVKELIQELLVDQGVATTVYMLPPREKRS